MTSKKNILITVKDILKVIEQAGGTEITADECENLAGLFNIDLKILKPIPLIRTLVLMGVTKKMLQKITVKAPDCFELDMTRTFTEMPGLKEKFLKEWDKSQVIDLITYQVAEQLIKDQEGGGNDTTH